VSANAYSYMLINQSEHTSLTPLNVDAMPCDTQRSARAQNVEEFG
jgi:hypothetical protein